MEGRLKLAGPLPEECKDSSESEKKAENGMTNLLSTFFSKLSFSFTRTDHFASSSKTSLFRIVSVTGLL